MKKKVETFSGYLSFIGLCMSLASYLNYERWFRFESAIVKTQTL
jgi:hypothetical protein